MKGYFAMDLAIENVAVDRVNLKYHDVDTEDFNSLMNWL